MKISIRNFNDILQSYFNMNKIDFFMELIENQLLTAVIICLYALEILDFMK